MASQAPALRTNPIEMFLDVAARRLDEVEKTLDGTWFIAFRFKKLRDCEAELGKIEALLLRLETDLKAEADPVLSVYGKKYRRAILAFSERLKEVSRKMALNGGVRDVFKGLPFYSGAVRIVAGSLRVMAKILDLLKIRVGSNWLLKAADFLEQNLLPQSAPTKQLPK